MPRGNGMGPMGMGPMTGRGAGYCAGFAVPGFANPAPGSGFAGGGRGFGGGGRGWRHRFYATGLPGWMRTAPVTDTADAAAPGREAQVRALKRQAEALEDSLVQVRERLAELEKSPSGR